MRASTSAANRRGAACRHDRTKGTGAPRREGSWACVFAMPGPARGAHRVSTLERQVSEARLRRVVDELGSIVERLDELDERSAVGIVRWRHIRRSGSERPSRRADSARRRAQRSRAGHGRGRVLASEENEGSSRPQTSQEIPAPATTRTSSRTSMRLPPSSVTSGAACHWSTTATDRPNSNPRPCTHTLRARSRSPTPGPTAMRCQTPSGASRRLTVMRIQSRRPPAAAPGAGSPTRPNVRHSGSARAGIRPTIERLVLGRSVRLPRIVLVVGVHLVPGESARRSPRRRGTGGRFLHRAARRAALRRARTLGGRGRGSRARRPEARTVRRDHRARATAASA